LTKEKVLSLKNWLTKNIYVTTPNNSDPFFRPRKYARPKEEVAGVVQEVIKSLSRWNVVEYRENQGRIHATHTTALFRFVDDVNIYVVQGLDGVTKLEIISQSRVGKGDLGQNKRNIRELFLALDAKLPPSAS
jgi:uncharacterized protein (DUF1499 family)